MAFIGAKIWNCHDVEQHNNLSDELYIRIIGFCVAIKNHVYEGRLDGLVG